MSTKEPFDYMYRVVVVGDSGVGKTNLLFRFTKNEFTPNLPSTIGIDFSFRNVRVENKIIRACIWDTAGQDKFKSISSSYYHGSVVAILVYDITKYESFTSLVSWLAEVRQHTSENIVITLVGNKSDLADKRVVSVEEAKQFAAANNMSFIETSALDSSNVDKAFLQAIKDAYDILTMNLPKLDHRGKEDIVFDKVDNTSRQLMVLAKPDKLPHKKCCNI